jgi:RNA polymerase sigma-70 factor, ECF subfamily
MNAALMRKRKERPQVDLPLENVLADLDADGPFPDDIDDWSHRADDPALRTEAMGVIQASVDGLEAKYRAVFQLRDVEGFSTAETGRIMGLGVPAVKTRLHRARLVLRQELATYFERSGTLAEAG